MLFFELIIIGILALFLETRMWRISDFSLKMSWKAIGAGILLLFVNNLILYLSLNIPFLSKASEQVTSIEFASGIVPNLPLMILTAVVINPFFEEIFLIGYLGKWFKNHSPLIFIITSTLIRMSYHTYQGVLGIYSVTVAGLLFTLYYLKYRNTVPIIVTHALYNLSYYLRNYYFED